MNVEINGMRVGNVGRQAVTLRPIAQEMTVRVPDMVRVAGGMFSMGSTRFTDARPIRQVTLRDFAIGKHPVTNGEYLDFLQVMGYKVPDIVANPEFASHPVVNISWNDVMNDKTGYCRFLRDITKTDESPSGRKFSLPTEAQWEFAARGTEGRTYPWGSESYEGRVNFNSKGTTPVDAHLLGATPSGIFGMSGNVWEWCADWYGTYTGNNLTNPKGPEKGTYRVLRGGSWYNDHSGRLMAAFRSLN
ncbi:MAG: SUMF1/EgtB/PvdO family nonheme iron enzyme [Candidatus Margulisiibacteriota bacterium]